ncbi:hypothetical protein HXX76_004032 [Chlamydomonas incerta]|uniref:DNA 3'-5' helicase n=1 Tax=Chlamydomonas incerta TaxID=51695 RepID=A0A835TLR1_CHLIN|nr:hypothetical protein HXX76_004032 [Chlamydomonas incerta]|eukprot:KAG2441180.1 hypothetical protein HXX76_004032 [Chlamydomonas incerta]
MRLLRQHFQLVDRGAGASGGSRLAALRKDFQVLEEDEQSAVIIRCLRDSEKAMGMRHDRSRVKRFKELVSYVKSRTETTQGLAPHQLLAVLGELAPHHSGLAEMVTAHVAAHGPLLASSGTHQVAAGPGHAPGAGRPSAVPGGAPARGELHLFLSCLLSYDRALAGRGACDFDDMLGLAVALMQQPAARRAAAATFRHILVDEVQDTNLPQYTLVQLLRSAGASLFVVGDANQSIYTWRGALPDMASAAAAAGPGVQSAAPGGQHLRTPARLDAQGAVVGPEAPDDTAASIAATADPASAAAAASDEPKDGPLTSPAASSANAAASAAGIAGSSSSSLYLRRNHRSLPHIVAVAERVINQQQEHSAVGLGQGEPTRLESVRPPQPGAAVAVVTTDSARDEARWVVRQIRAITGLAAAGPEAEGAVRRAGGGQGDADGAPARPPPARVFRLGDVAILYRVNRQARYLEEALQEAGLPYCLPKSQPFWAGEQVRDVAAFLHLAARPLEVTGAMAASLLTRPARGVPAGSSVLSRLRRPSVRLGPGVSSASMGRLLFGDMVTQPQLQAVAGGHGNSGGGASGPEADSALGLRFPRPDVAAAGGDGAGAPAVELVDPAAPPPALAQAVADAMQLLVPPPSEQQERWRPQTARHGAEPGSDLDGRRGAGSAKCAAMGAAAGAAAGPDVSAPRYMPLPASALRRKLAFTDLDADDPPWMLIVDNEAFPAPLAPPLPDEVCQTLGIRPGDAEYDGITFLRDLVVLLQVAPHLGYTPEELVNAIVRATGYETWLELEQGDHRDLSDEVGRLTELRQAAEQYGWDYRAAAAASAAVLGQEAASAAAAGAVPTVSEFSNHVRQLVEAAAQSGSGGRGHDGAHSGSASKTVAGKAPAGAHGSRASDKHSDADAQKKREPAAAPVAPPEAGAGSDSAECVRLLTLHGSKGLEFPVVFLTGAEDGLLPHSASRNNPIQQREERRLLFVGITRAMDQLYLTWAATRAAYRHRLLLGRAAAEAGHLGAGSRRAAHERMPYMSPFVARLLQELHAEGLVVEAGPGPDGCVAMPAACPPGTAAAKTGRAPTAPPAPLVAYHDATKARNMSLASLVMKL